LDKQGLDSLTSYKDKGNSFFLGTGPESDGSGALINDYAYQILYRHPAHQDPCFSQRPTRASVRATKKKSESPMASLAAATLPANCGSIKIKMRRQSSAYTSPSHSLQADADTPGHMTPTASSPPPWRSRGHS